MTATMKVFVTGDTPYTGVSKATGKPFSITRVYVTTDNKPFPEEIGIMEEIRLSKGHYDVPYSFDIYQGRLQVRFDFSRAVLSTSDKRG